MSTAYKVFLAVMTLILLLGLAVLVYGLTHEPELPRLTPRYIHVAGRLMHG
ncbi:MAG: hypothetical protein ACI4OY_07555 [Aristaeellaceae bacterium]